MATTDGRPAPAAGPRFDLLVQGGHLIDLAAGRSGLYDVGVIQGRVASVAPTVPASEALKVLDASGCVVLPGLMDLHTHVFFGGTYWGVDPRAIAWRSGVTTWVDAGSAGAYNVGALRQICTLPGTPRVRAFLNISAMGLVAETGEAARDEVCDPGLCAATIEEHRDFLVGVKCRLDRFATGGTGILPLKRALEAAGRAGVPVMAHIGVGPPGIDEVLDLLRPGDLVTHCATGQDMSLVEASGELRPSAVAARQRGVLLDVGHGSGGFSYAVAEAMLAAGAPPDVISSDLHQRSVIGPAFDLPTCMSKYLALGMPLEDIARAVTVNPARAIGDEAGTNPLEVGQSADLAIFELEESELVLYDTYLEGRKADRLLVNRATVIGGVTLPPVPPPAPAPWVEVTEAQRSLLGGMSSALGGKDLALSPDGGALRRPWASVLDHPGAFVPLALSGPPGAGLPGPGRPGPRPGREE